MQRLSPTIIIVVFLFLYMPLAFSNGAFHQILIPEEPEQLHFDPNWNTEDSLIFKQLIQYADAHQLNTLPLPDIEMAVAKFFLSTPYVGKTLEKEGEEKLVINLREMDCTTFVENVLAFSLCIKRDDLTHNAFEELLTTMRYRHGKIDGYSSRLHYFTDWLKDNEDKGILKIISNEFATEAFDARVNWMSTHPQFYPQLENQEFLMQISEKEKEISKRHFTYIPKDKIDDLAHFIHNGDILALTTNIDGLDISHVGLAKFIDDRLHLFHASSKKADVEVSAVPLQIYLGDSKTINGIIVARLN